MKKDNVIYEKKCQCDICGSKRLKKELLVEDFDTKLGSFDILNCPKCGMKYTSARPTDSTLHYLYEQRGSKNFDEKGWFFFEFLKDFLAEKQMKSYIKNVKFIPESFVDFGTGNGRYACMLKKSCPECKITGVDFAPNPPERFRETANINYMLTNDFYKQDNLYDVIYLRHVLEHTSNPCDFLKTLSKKLTKRGCLIIEVPNVQSGVSKLFKQYSSAYYVPYHLVHFTKENIRVLMETLDFKYLIGSDEMPVLSNNLANLFHKPLDNKFRLLGMMLHPLQILINSISNSHCAITVIASQK